jgi:hypothetical protein
MGYNRLRDMAKRGESNRIKTCRFLADQCLQAFSIGSDLLINPNVYDLRAASNRMSDAKYWLEMLADRDIDMALSLVDTKGHLLADRIDSLLNALNQ